jgi:hypothetical protein
MGSERMRPASAAYELLGAFIAWMWDIKVVSPVLIDITSDFVETLKGQEIYQKAVKSIGLTYGSIYEPNFETIPNFKKLTYAEIEAAKKIFSFDIFIGNADRRLQKPNCMSNGETIVVYDHELAFSFLQILFSNPEPWQIRLSDRVDWIEKMFFYSKLKGQNIDYDETVRILNTINNDFWDKAFSLIPSEWTVHDDLNKIKSYLSLIVANRGNFVNNINVILE